MSFQRLLHIVALSAFALVLLSATTPVNALVTDRHSLARRSAGAHDYLGRRKRQSSGRCRAASNNNSVTTTNAGNGDGSSSSSGDNTNTNDNTGGSNNAAPPPPSSPPPSDPNSGGSSSGSSSGGSSGGSTPAIPPPPPPPSNSGGSGGGKMGLAWPNGDDPSLANFISPNVGYMYTWDAFCPQNRMGLNCMPMLWSNDPTRVNNFRQTVVPGYGNIALGFNEINEPGQANMSPQDAAGAWLQNLEPLKNQGYKLVCPVTSSNPNGLQMLKDFFTACQNMSPGGCTCDYMAVHYYDVSVQGFKDYLNLWHDTFGRDIFVTEYDCQNFNGGAQCSPDETWNFHKEMAQYMQSTPWIVSYMPFGAMHDMSGVNPTNQLMNPDGSLTALGAAYVHNSW